MRHLAIIFFVLCHVHSFGQCNNNNTYDGSFSLSSEGDSGTISCVRGGRYYTLDVASGETYEFSTCGGDWDTYITLYSDSDGSLIAFNDDYCGWQSFISWSASFTGTVRVLIDEWDCTGYNSCGAQGPLLLIAETQLQALLPVPMLKVYPIAELQSLHPRFGTHSLVLEKKLLFQCATARATIAK
jgi:hypothetical protein